MTESVRAQVEDLVKLGRMPTSAQAEAHPVGADQWEALINEVSREGALTDAEAAVLITLLPEDQSDCYGVAWTLLHAIESAPGWPLTDALNATSGPWVQVLEKRADNSPTQQKPVPN